MTRLKQWLTDAERNEKFVAQEELFKLEMEMHEKKLKMQAELCVSKKNPETVECETSAITVAKLPKLVISKFDGSFMDWPRFWGQFSEAIDKSSIAPISKLTYLLELLEPLKLNVVLKPCPSQSKAMIVRKPFSKTSMVNNPR